MRGRTGCARGCDGRNARRRDAPPRATSRENHDRYNSYSGAAIGGTLLLLVPIAYLDELLFAIVKDFAIAAILGGGAGAYLSLRSDSAGEAANKFGAGLLGLVDKVLD